LREGARALGAQALNDERAVVDNQTLFAETLSQAHG